MNEQSLGGLMFYTLNGDDLHESCGPHLPLISTAEKCFKDQIECREIVEKFKNRDFKWKIFIFRVLSEGNLDNFIVFCL